MITHIFTDIEHRYSIFEIPFIKENQDDIVATVHDTSDRINQFLNSQKESKDITWFYQHYNAFTATSGDRNFYNLFVAITRIIAEYFKIHQVTTDNMLYMQSWINNHTHDEVLGVHNHTSPVHGYISIDPKFSKTVFTKGISDEVMYEIENLVGRVYIGAGNQFHKVENTKMYDGHRITIAFDINDEKNTHLSFIPIII
jgi:hypothetical protein